MDFFRLSKVTFFFLSITSLPILSETPDVEFIQRHETYEDKKTLEDDLTMGQELKVVGKDFEKFGEELVGRIDRLVRRKGFRFLGDPWTIQGLPLAFPSGSTGFNLGLRLMLVDIAREDPHKFALEAQVLASDKGRYKHFAQIDYPQLFGGGYRLIGRISYDREISFRYFGIGNQTAVIPSLLDSSSVHYQNVRKGPAIHLQFLKRFGKYFRVGPVLNLKWQEVNAPVGSKLEAERPVGILGGRTHSVGLAFIYDRLDFEPYPSEGDFHELFVNKYGSFISSDYDFLRVTYTFRRYIPLHRTLTFAHRTLIESVTGEVPFYELNAVGGSDSTVGFGGDRFFRGYDSNRFVDHYRMVLGFELRWDPLRFTFAKQDFVAGFVPFIDFGRVWHKLYPIEIRDFHGSIGWGTRLIWNSRFILRGDFAVNSEQTSFYVELGNSF